MINCYQPKLVLGRLTVNQIGEVNSVLGYALLQALRPGGNITWSLHLQQKILDGLQISLNYEGRKSPGQNVIHTGRMQVSALF